jgi:hypothetical protein
MSVSVFSAGSKTKGRDAFGAMRDEKSRGVTVAEPQPLQKSATGFQ